MSAVVLTWLFGAGVAQGLFLCGALASLKVRNVRARWLLVAVIAVFTIILLEEFLEMAGADLRLGVGLVAEFALGPLLLFFVTALVEDDPTPVAKKLRHFIPLGFATAWLFWLHLAFPREGVSLSYPEMRHLVGATALTKIAVFAAYLTVMLRRSWSLSAKPAAARRALAWVRGWIWVSCAAYALTALSFVAFYLRIETTVDSDIIGALVLVASIFGLGYFAIANRNVFDLRTESPSSAQQAEFAGIVERTRHHLEKSRAYLDPEFSLRNLADALQLGDAKLSTALNLLIEGGFHALMNNYRLDAFCDLVRGRANRERSILDLALQAGFGSKATFYRLFRAREGVTPSAYRQRALGLNGFNETGIEAGTPGQRPMAQG